MQIAAAAAATAATGAVEITLPVAIVAAAYIIGQSKVGQGGVPIPIRTERLFGRYSKRNKKDIGLETRRWSYWEDFYIIDVLRPNDRRHFISASEYFQELGSSDEDDQGRKAWGDRLTFHSEVNHVSVNGDVAVATAQFYYQLSAAGGGRNNDGHMSLWVAEKRNGVWKWKSAQMVDRFR